MASSEEKPFPNIIGFYLNPLTMCVANTGKIGKKPDKSIAITYTTPNNSDNSDKSDKYKINYYSQPNFNRSDDESVNISVAQQFLEDCRNAAEYYKILKRLGSIDMPYFNGTNYDNRISLQFVEVKEINWKIARHDNPSFPPSVLNITSEVGSANLSSAFGNSNTATKFNSDYLKFWLILNCITFFFCKKDADVINIGAVIRFSITDSFIDGVLSKIIIIEAFSKNNPNDIFRGGRSSIRVFFAINKWIRKNRNFIILQYSGLPVEGAADFWASVGFEIFDKLMIRKTSQSQRILTAEELEIQRANDNLLEEMLNGFNEEKERNPGISDENAIKNTIVKSLPKYEISDSDVIETLADNPSAITSAITSQAKVPEVISILIDKAIKSSFEKLNSKMSLENTEEFKEITDLEMSRNFDAAKQADAALGPGRGVCYEFYKTGKCERGVNCAFSHNESSSGSSSSSSSSKGGFPGGGFRSKRSKKRVYKKKNKRTKGRRTKGKKYAL